jgi:hypothetical protein
MKGLFLLFLVACNTVPTLATLDPNPRDERQNVRLARMHVLRAWMAVHNGLCDEAAKQMRRARAFDSGSQELLAINDQMQMECTAGLGRGDREPKEPIP